MQRPDLKLSKTSGLDLSYLTTFAGKTFFLVAPIHFHPIVSACFSTYHTYSLALRASWLLLFD